MDTTSKPDAPIPNQRRSNVAEWLPVAIVLLTILFVAVVRLRLADTPLERDEGEFAYAGQLIKQGEVPYKYCYNIKLPGTYAAYAVIMTLFGETPVGIHLGLLLVNIASIALIYLVAKKLDSKATGAMAAIVFALLSLDPAPYGFAAHATHFVVLFALLGFYFLFKAMETEKRLDAIASGVCMSVSFLCKQPGLAFGVMAFGFFMWLATKRGKPTLRFYYLIGWLAPYGIVCLIMLIAGAFGLFWSWTVTYAAAHGRSFAQVLPSIRAAMLETPFPLRAIGVLVILFVVYLATHPAIQLWKRVFVSALLVSATAAVSAGFYFYLHYFIMLIPAVAIIVAMALNTMAADLRTRMFGSAAAFIPGAVVALWAALTIAWLFNVWFVWSPDELVARRYLGNPFVQTRRIASYLSTNCPPNARIAVLQSEPEIFVYTHHRSSTGFIYAYDLTAPSPVRFELEKQFKEDLVASDPDYIVFVAAPFAWTPQDHAGLALADWCYAFAQSNATRIAVADGMLPDTDQTIYKWDRDALDYKRQFPKFVEVYRRNSAGSVIKKQ
jgi:hypothetical protein